MREPWTRIEIGIPWVTEHILSSSYYPIMMNVSSNKYINMESGYPSETPSGYGATKAIKIRVK